MRNKRIDMGIGTETLPKTLMKLLLLGVCILGLTDWISSVGHDQDMTVRELLNNLQTEHFSGKPIDLDLEEADIETLLKNLENFSGLSFKLSPDIYQLSKEKKTYSFKQVPWDQVLFLVLKEFGLETVMKDGSIYIQQKTDNLKRIIREDQLQSPNSLRIHPFLYVLIFVVIAGGIAGFLLYKRRFTNKEEASKRLVIDPEVATEVIKRVTYLFDVEKVYRNEDISLRSLSEELSIPSYQLSWIVNERMNITFSVLVNTYRVDEVKKRLTSLQDKDKAILNIAFEAGFNTKTSFNRVFKKFTRMTPSQYRERYMPKKMP
jgi:AraC-like DNA-binding protein